MKYYITLISFFLLSSCGGQGGGHVQFYNFVVSKRAATNEIKKIIDSSNKHIPPTNWKGYDEGSEPNDIFVYFNSGPQEIYLIRFRDFGKETIDTQCTLGLVGVYNGKFWLTDHKLSSSEEDRIKNRFESEILSKIKYSYSKE